MLGISTMTERRTRSITKTIEEDNMWDEDKETENGAWGVDDTVTAHNRNPGQAAHDQNPGQAAQDRNPGEAAHDRNPGLDPQREAELRDQVKTLEGRIRENSQKIHKLERENTELKSKNNELHDDKEALAQELEKANENLTDAKALSADLLNRLDDSSPSSTESKPSVLVLTDNPDLSSALSDRSFSWKMEVKAADSVKSLANVMSNDQGSRQYEGFDKIVLLMGTSEILEGEDGHQVATNIVRLAKLIFNKLSTPVAAVQLPPMRDQKRQTAITLLNSMLQRQLTSGEFDFIEVVRTQDKNNKYLKGQLVKADGYSATALGLSLIFEALEEQITVAVREKPESKPSFASSDEEIQEAIQINDDQAVGVIIGNKGSNIRALQAKTNTQVHIVPVLRQDRKVSLALIVGNSQGRAAAKEEIFSIIRTVEKSDSGKRSATSDPRLSKFMK